MAQVGWVFLDDRGGRHRVGLYHGDQSGHVVIHCNLRVVQIDFSVKESKTYSFFIEDEFCEVHLEKEKEGFSYEFLVNKTADTPRNQERRTVNRRNNRFLMIMIGGLVLLVSSFLLAVRYFQDRGLELETPGPFPAKQVSTETLLTLRQQGKTAEARFFLVKENGRRAIFYGFSTPEGRQVSGRYPVPSSGEVLLPNGFPLTDQDAFEVRYLPATPETHFVDFFQPTPATLGSYVQRAVEAQQLAHPDEREGYAKCLAEQTLVLRGWPSLGHLIFQEQRPEQNHRYNHDSYQQLVRSADIQKGVSEKCWNQ